MTTYAELKAVREYPQSSELHLSIYKPNVILACQVEDPGITKGARTITYNLVTTGSYTKVLSGMTLWVGTTAGSKDLGKVRVKSASFAAIIVAENSDVRWQDDAYLTIVDIFDIVPVFPRIIADPNNAENTLWYKDYDIEYTDQNTLLGSFISMGPHRAGNLDGTGACSFYFSASGTKHVNDEVLSYEWQFPGADTVTGSTSMIPGWITYKSAQHTQAILKVTSDSGSVDDSYRYVSVYPNGDNSQGWEIGNFQGARSSNGYVLDMTIHEPWKYEIYEGACVVVYQNSWYGTNQTNLGGNALNCSNILFSGYILQDSIKWTYDRSSVTFKVGSVTEIMKLINGFAISVENSTTTASTWYQIHFNNLRKSIYHFLRWHTTVLKTTDIKFTANDRYIQYFDSDRGSAFDAIASVLASALLGEVTCDRQGTVWLENSVEATHNAKTVFVPDFTLEKDDWIGEPAIQDVPYNTTSYMELGGIKYIPYDDNTETASSAFLACAPGISPSTHGKVESPTGLALLSQDELNDIVGDVFAYHNAKIPTIDFDLRGNFLNLDIAPIQVLRIVINSEDTSKNKAIDNSYHIVSLRLSYKGDTQSLLTSATLHEVTEGVAGDTLIIPVVAPDDVPTDHIGFPTFPPIPDPVVPPTPLFELCVLVIGFGIYYCNYKDELYSWHSANTPFTAEQQAALKFLELSSDGLALVGTDREVYSTVLGSDVGYTVGDEALFLSDLGTDPLPNLYAVRGLGINHSATQGFSAVVARSYPNAKLATYVYDGSSLVKAYLDITGFYDPEGTQSITYYNGNWYVCGAWGLGQDPFVVRFDSNFNISEDFYLALVDDGKFIKSVHARSADYLYAWFNDLNKIVGSGSSTTFYDGMGAQDGMDCDPTGQYLIRITTNHIWKSSDYGATWVDITSIVHSFTGGTGTIRTGQVLNLGSSLAWAISYNDVDAAPGPTLNLWITADGGITWYSALGDLYAQGVPTNGSIGVMRYA